MKKVLKKLLILLMIIVIINNFLVVSSYAANHSTNEILDAFAGLLGGIIGLLTWPLRIVALGAGKIMNWLSAIVAYTEDATDPSIDTSVITPYDIFFNHVKLLDINFFDIGTEDNFINNMRTGIASWYYVMRMISAAILLVILIYVGIRMALSTVASDKAIYKRMLVDWVVGLALIFFINYIIIFVIYVNDAIVNVIEGAIGGSNAQDQINDLFNMGKKVFDINAMGATIVYVMLVWQTFGLVISYFNRMMKIGFLIIIAPLISVTYSIDKISDGKAQALNAWLKEFIFTVLIQPFHCIIYMSLIDVAFKLLSSGDNMEKLGRMLVAIMMIRFIKEGEKIVRKIFNFKDDNSKTSAVAAMAATGIAINQAKNIGKVSFGVAKGTVNFGKNTVKAVQNAKVNALALAAVAHNADGTKKTFEERKEEVRTSIEEKKAEKIADKKGFSLNKKSEGELQRAALDLMKADSQLSFADAMVKARDNDLGHQVDIETEKVKAKHNGSISDKEARAIAKRKVAEKESLRRSKITQGIKKVRKTTGKFVNNHIPEGVRNTANMLTNLKTPAVLADLAKEYGKASVSAGVGLMVGAGAYGTGQSVWAAAAIGGATSHGISQEFKNSTRTMNSSTKKHLKELNVNNGAQAREKLNDINSRRDEFGNGSKADEKLSDILNDLKSALVANNMNDQMAKDKISKIRNDITNNPSAAPNFLDGLLSDVNVQSGTSAENAYLKAFDKVKNYANENAIAHEMESSESLNITAGQFIANVAESYDTNPISKRINASGDLEEREKATGVKYEEMHDEQDYMEDTSVDKDERKEFVTEKTRALDDGQLSDLAAKYQREIDALLDRYGQGEDDLREFNSEVDKLIRERDEVIARALADERRKLTRVGESLLDEYQQKLDDAIFTMDKQKDNALTPMEKDNIEKRMKEFTELYNEIKKRREEN